MQNFDGDTRGSPGDFSRTGSDHNHSYGPETAVGSVRQSQNTLIDRFDRRVHYLRLSVTDRCDFRCIYCMTEKMQFLPRSEVLSLEEMLQVAETFVALGVDKIRLTGGEPLIRNGVMQLVRKLGQLPGLQHLVLTTNGSRLQRHAQELKAAGVRRINISLDSLKPQRFRELTRHGELQTVLKGIEAAAAAGFERIKINAVILRGHNEDEIVPLVAFARDLGADISFIEEMPLGPITDHDRGHSQFGGDEVRAAIAAVWSLSPCDDSTGGPSRYYRMADSDSRVGFITPNSHNFCASCNRVRLTAAGRLLLCLGNEHSVDLRQVLRQYPGDQQRLRQAIRQSMQIKPERHYFDPAAAEPQIVRLMNATGG